jgi:hypothetical protein
VTVKNHLVREAHYQRRDGNILDLEIPYDLIGADDFVLLNFSIPTATAPKDIGESSDDRRLGIGVISARVEC